MKRPAATPVGYKPEAAAEALGISRANLYRLLNTGAIRAKKLGGSTIVERSELERFVDELPEAQFGRSQYG